MKVTIEGKARPCPGVERAVILAEDALNRGEKLFPPGQLIHNRREVERLHEMGLKQIRLEDFDQPRKCKEFENATFLVRSHGESEEKLEKARGCGMKIVEAPCPIVKHSQELVDQHVREGYRILIAGNENHPEVVGLLARTHGSGMIISALSQLDKVDLDDRSFMLAQTTIDGTFFSEIRKSLSARLPGLKIADTTCRFLNNSQKDITDFGKEQDVVLVVGGHNSSNCKLLAKTCQTVNPHVYQVEGP